MEEGRHGVVRSVAVGLGHIRSEDVSAELIAKQTVAALRHMGAELEAGALLTIEADRTRLRMLPLRTEE